MDSSTKKSSLSYFCVSKKEMCKTTNSTSVWVAEANQSLHNEQEYEKCNIVLHV